MPVLLRRIFGAREARVEILSASRILRSGNSAEKIRILQAARSIDDQDMLEEVVSRLDDEDIRVRGEAFGLLVLTDGDVSGFY